MAYGATGDDGRARALANDASVSETWAAATTATAAAAGMVSMMTDDN